MLRSVKVNLIIFGTLLLALMMYYVVVAFNNESTKYCRYLVASDVSGVFTIIDSKSPMTKEEIPYSIDRYWDLDDPEAREILSRAILLGVFEFSDYDTYYDDRINSVARRVDKSELVEMIVDKGYLPN